MPDAEGFERHLDVIMAVGRPVSLGEVLEAQRQGRRLPYGSVLLTFDDGHRSVYDAAFPVLRRRSVPAVVYIVPGVVGTNLGFWWDEVAVALAQVSGDGPSTVSDRVSTVSHETIEALKVLPDGTRRTVLQALSSGMPPRVWPQLTWAEVVELDRSGVSVGNHTMTHPLLDRCDTETVREEIANAHELLADHLGSPPRSFAYPNGNYDVRAIAVLQDLGYELAFLFDSRTTQVPTRQPLRMSRLRVDATDEPMRIRLAVTGLEPLARPWIKRSARLGQVVSAMGSRGRAIGRR